ncbi:phytoene desaturase family protein [Alteribacter natronophilus]|uniref:phytoene desaturase family protein n=1 Tax=Alteribacter natronophilus TaxID=2583810 RepID=UPI00110E588E|nr:phytoene desaturase family protein [Alteribacter natronophilus]TMW73700.1 phytoene desaturase [Alteribacter natronophilus]
MTAQKRKGRVAVIGAGPGGLASAMLLAYRGFKVDVYEKQPYIGGRTSRHKVGDFQFDLGPTFFSMPHILEEIFEAAGKNLHDYVELKKLDPMYELDFDGLKISAVSDKERMKEQIDTLFPGSGKEYVRFMDDTRRKMNRLLPMLQNKHASLFDYMRLRSLKALPELEVGRSLYDVLGRYFEDERLRLSFTFQSKYLGMSPWECPGAFSILSFMEHEWGVYHPVGGLNRLTRAMADAVNELGGKIHTGNGAKRLILDGRKVTGLELDSGEQVSTDEVVMNADFAQAMTTLIDESAVKKYSRKKLEKKNYSCSTFMIYAGINKQVDLGHHTIFFSGDYKRNVEEITKTRLLSEDPSIYVHHASATDPTVAPEGKAALYILAPVPNNFSGIDWAREKKAFRDLVWDLVEQKTGEDLREHLEVEDILTPLDWEHEKHVFRGATFNLSHNLGQMMYFRPHNKFESLEGLWLTGGGTHPGSGLPTIFESARITSDGLSEKYGKSGVIS